MNAHALRMPEEIRRAAAAQARRAGMSLDEYLLSIVAARVGAQGEAERAFAARAARATPAQAKEVLARVGQGRPPEPGDELPPDVAEGLAARRRATPEDAS